MDNATITNSQTLTLNSNWLDTTTAGQVTIGNNWTYPYYVQPTYTWITKPEKVTLKLSEIERLRAAAKKDKALREILAKFTDHIEIAVDFE